MLKQSVYYKIQTAVPAVHADKVRRALGDAGAGKVGNYSHCSGSWKSFGRFTPLENANPTIGQVGKPEKVEEEVIEVICHKDKIKAVLKALRSSHPYEEPPIDILSRYEWED